MWKKERGQRCGLAGSEEGSSATLVDGNYKTTREEERRSWERYRRRKVVLFCCLLSERKKTVEGGKQRRRQKEEKRKIVRATAGADDALCGVEIFKDGGGATKSDVTESERRTDLLASKRQDKTQVFEEGKEEKEDKLQC